MKILAIETSCDETSLAIIDNDTLVCNLVLSQIKNHREYKGVIPELAARLHYENFHFLFEEMTKYNVELNSIDVITYTSEPGLPGALSVGKVLAETLSYLLNVKTYPINHIYGHINSVNIDDNYLYPAIALVVSGGHTNLYLLKDKKNYELLGKSLDDAAGECLDKVGKVMGLDYPAGPEIDKLANSWYGPELPCPNLRNRHEYNFSYSGIKSYFINYWNSKPLVKEQVSYTIQNFIISDLMTKAEKAIKNYQARSFSISGGVSNNNKLRMESIKLGEKLSIKVLIPHKEFTTDNAAMIANAFKHINR
ncbi:hypothetical protein ASO20_02080 [Mycoplasma sp. (ex Biomphalaria glabrata)]|uniref:tRNA (adenosine(37)-N6)-threonylcarbamoyltransferase complex transferase subunit TsaD n=1 Tax=Mycoplasma sp. (ex Biomphalaria glabrata) TaxID=1749074 RepID=UPI00073A96FD|nr:tRNA (adenosine(37)-N6)-threonylcarbamoyltransferase complex transferase subunit TsaD [Mycoplasma sp. (ex Biomphalaria glabrata)]ALV23430.1 hypothetical protein ASO20_02080 [Mycoplasma sp. (ex Biomphalaria glabrata)]